MPQINIQFTLFSAFYSPLISTMSGDFLRAEGLEPNWSVSPPGVSAINALADGFGPASKGEPSGVVDFAQVNEMDGFFITTREPDPDFI